MVSKTFGNQSGTLSVGDLDINFDELQAGQDALSASMAAQLSTVNSRLAALEAGSGGGGVSGSLPTDSGTFALKTLSGSTNYVISDSGSGDYTGVEDTSLESVNGTPPGDQPYGAGNQLQVYSWSAGTPDDLGRSLVRFTGLADLATALSGSLPITVSAATLTLYCADVVGTGSETIEAFKVVRSGWTEAGATWLKYDGTNAWSVSGAGGAEDVDPNVIATQNVTVSGQYYDWTSAALATLVEGWINGTIANGGLLLKRNPEDAYSVTSKRFSSSDNSPANAAHRPKLTVSISDTWAEDYSVAVGDTYQITSPTLTGGTSGGSTDNSVTNEYYTIHVGGAVVQTLAKTGSTQTFDVVGAWAGQSGFVRYHATHAAGSVVIDSDAFTVASSSTFQMNAMNSPLSLTVGRDLALDWSPQIGPMMATWSGSSGAVTFSYDPQLPEGLTFSSSSSRISGTPTTAQAATSYTLTGIDEALEERSVSVSISIAAAPSSSVAWTAEIDPDVAWGSQTSKLAGINVQSCGQYPALSSLGDHWNGSGLSNNVGPETDRVGRVQLDGKWYLKLGFYHKSTVDGEHDPWTSGGTNYVRSDINTSGKGLLYNGDTYFAAMIWRCPASIWNKPVGETTGNWGTMWSIHGANTSQTDLATRGMSNSTTNGNQNKLMVMVNSGGASGTLALMNLTPYITADTDHKIVIHEKIDTSGSGGGFVRVYVDGVLRGSHLGKNHDPESYWYPKFQCYNGSLACHPSVSPIAGQYCYWWYFRHAAWVKDNSNQYSWQDIHNALKDYTSPPAPPAVSVQSRLRADQNINAQSGTLQLGGNYTSLSTISEPGTTGGNSGTIDGSTLRFGRFSNIGGAGITAVRFAILTGDTQTAGGIRSDVVMGPVNSFADQDTYWFAVRMYVPSTVYNRTPGAGTGNYCALFDLHGNGSGDQTQLCLRSYGGAGNKINLEILPNQPGIVVYQLENYFTPDAWHDVVIKEKISGSSNGSYQLWIDGTQRVNYSGATHNGTDSYYMKLACYDGNATIPSGGYWWFLRDAFTAKDNSGSYTQDQVRATLLT